MTTTFWDTARAAVEGARNGGGLLDAGLATFRDGAILGVAAGAVASVVIAGTELARGLPSIGLGRLAAELRTEAIDSIAGLADRTSERSTTIARLSLRAGVQANELTTGAQTAATEGPAAVVNIALSSAKDTAR
ncbi:MAG TPA: hypothetical protein VGO47_11835, partial [Chlamydiales bacterium]|nr:hypothetical protein [Chlamydiales bacterium]